MRNFINAACILAVSAFGVPTITVGSANAASMFSCLSSASTGDWKVNWVRGGDGRCPGSILTEDAGAIANMANKGHTEFRIWFYIPEKCPASGWAYFPVKAKSGVLNMYPWAKTCSKKGYLPPRLVK